MIYITGDTHGQYRQFKSRKIRGLRGKSRKHGEDTLIICGDFGFLWDGSRKEQKILQKIGKLRHNTLFVDGVHENFKMLSEYPAETWKGGLTLHICGNLRYLCRGQVFEIEDSKIFTMGGGVREDIGVKPAESMEEEAEEIENYIPDLAAPETPTAEDIAESLKNLAAAGGRVDYVITYEPPGSVGDFRTITTGRKTVGRGKTVHSDAIRTVGTVSEKLGFLDEIEKQITYGRWFFGKHHVNRIVTDKVFAVFDGVIRADHDVHKRRTKNGGF